MIKQYHLETEMLSAAATLRQPLVERAHFDPTNPDHLASLDAYLQTGNWGAVQFFPELPFVEVPITVLTKFAMHQRKVRSETEAERKVRVATKPLIVRQAPETREQKQERLLRASALMKA